MIHKEDSEKTYTLYAIKATRKPLKLLSKCSYGNCIQLADAKWKLWKDDSSTPSGMALLVFLSADEERLDAMEVSGSADLECEVITQYGSY